MAIATEKLLTAEEFAAMPDPGYPVELVRGKVIEMSPPGFLHGRICVRIGRLVDAFAEEQKLGQAASNDSGVITERGPDSVRGPEVAFYSFERLPLGASPVGYPSVPPDLVFEVKSPSDRWSLIQGKVAEYLRAGVRVVCIVDPDSSRIHIHRDLVGPEVLNLNDTFTVPEVLPGFSVPVRRIFE